MNTDDPHLKCHLMSQVILHICPHHHVVVLNLRCRRSCHNANENLRNNVITVQCSAQKHSRQVPLLEVTLLLSCWKPQDFLAKLSDAASTRSAMSSLPECFTINPAAPDIDCHRRPLNQPRNHWVSWLQLLAKQPFQPMCEASRLRFHLSDACSANPLLLLSPIDASSGTISLPNFVVSI